MDHAAVDRAVVVLVSHGFWLKAQGSAPFARFLSLCSLCAGFHFFLDCRDFAQPFLAIAWILPVWFSCLDCANTDAPNAPGTT